MKELVEESIDILASGMDILAFGDLLHEAWQAKRSLSPKVSNGAVDELYERARSAGAAGGKLTGAGRRGVLLPFVPAGRQPAAGRQRGARRPHSRPLPVRVGRQPDHLLRARRRLPRGGAGAPVPDGRPIPRAVRRRPGPGGGMNRTARVYVAGGDTLIGAALV